jgi:crossover junction endodeoxyribonuclease RuvC
VKILGIDPGIGRTGWGVVTSKNNHCINPKYGCIETSPKLSTEKRLNNINDENPSKPQ